VDLERDSRRTHRTQIFIETPYRNAQLLQAIFDVCHGGTLLCLATDLTQQSESIHTQCIAAWKAHAAPNINRRPTVFLLHCDT